MYFSLSKFVSGRFLAIDLTSGGSVAAHGGNFYLCGRSGIGSCVDDASD